MRVEASVVIERPVADVFRFYADEHVRDHPRWNPDLEVAVDSTAPIGVGTLMRRRSRMSGSPVDGTMEVVEMERDRTMVAVIREGGIEYRGHARFETTCPDRTRPTIGADMPWLSAESDASRIRGFMERSVQNIKKLIGAEA